MIAASLVVAEFQVPIAFDLAIAELRLVKPLVAARAQIAVRWQGRQLGEISFLAFAAKFNGAKFDETYARSLEPQGSSTMSGARCPELRNLATCRLFAI